MKNHFTVFALLMIMVPPCALKSFAQGPSATIEGFCRDAHGKPIVDGRVVWSNPSTGQRYTLKTNQNGQYFSLGIAPAVYNVFLYRNANDAQSNKEISHVYGVQVLVEDKHLDFDKGVPIQDEPANQNASMDTQPKGVSVPQGQPLTFSDENEKIRYLNSQLILAKQARTNGNFEECASILTSALTRDPAQDLLWFWLGETYRLSGDYAKAIHPYQKAIEIKPAFGPYHNNLGDAYNKSKRVDDAVSEYAIAAQVDSTGAANYAFNMGAVFANSGRSQDAVSAFGLAIKLDPTRAEAYYWKGVELFGLSIVQPPAFDSPKGTREAFRKYLELSPNGPYSKQASQMLGSITNETLPSLPYEESLIQAFEAAQPYNSREEYKAGTDAEIVELRRQKSSLVWAEKVSDFWTDPTIASALQRQLVAERQAEAQVRANAQAAGNSQSDLSQTPDDASSHSKVASFLSVMGVVLNTTNAGLQQAAANNAAREQARLAAQQAAAQRAAAQQAQQSQRTASPTQAPATQAYSPQQQASGRPSGNAGNSSAGSGGSTRPTPQASDLGITQNFVDPACNSGLTNAHYEITNNSYYSASIRIQLSYQVGGVQSTWSPTQNVNPRSSTDYTQQIPCSDQSDLSDFGNSSIIQWKFF